MITTLAHDLENDPDIVAMVATSAALTISGVPFMGPIGGVRVGYLDGKFVINPTLEQTEQSKLDLVVAGTKEGVLMVESEAKELDEATMLSAVMEGHRSYPAGDRRHHPARRACRQGADAAHRSAGSGQEPWPSA